MVRSSELDRVRQAVAGYLQRLLKSPHDRRHRRTASSKTVSVASSRIPTSRILNVGGINDGLHQRAQCIYENAGPLARDLLAPL
jgi:hypothetical protein